jgi:hypothetical protein
MSNEHNKAPNAPASDAANQPAKTGVETKPEAVVAPGTPATAPAETKKI